MTTSAPALPAQPSSRGPSPFDAVVFAGGGCRCFWQSGFWSVVAPALNIEPDVVAAVSAGAAFACAALLGESDRAMEDFKRRVAGNPRNVYPFNWLRGEPVFPHEAIYRSVILSGLERVGFDGRWSGPDLRILLARPPSWAGARLGFVAGGVAYAFDRFELRVHPRWGRRFGFEAEVVSARSCADASDLMHAILHSSCTPPVMPAYRRDERLVLDGGLVDNAPADWVGERRSTLVLLTRDYPPGVVPSVPGRTYVRPSRTIPIVKWDYTSPERIQETYDLGRRDGEAFVSDAVAFEWMDDGATRAVERSVPG